MSNHHIRAIFAVVFVTASMLSAGAGAAGAQSHPFRMSLQGNANPAPTGDPCVLTNTESGTGHATRLGRISWESSETVDLCADGGPLVQGEFTVTAANGDQVFGRYRTVARMDSATNEIAFAGLWEFTGGTGQFHNAEGDGHLAGEGSLLPPFDVMADFSGDISY